MEFKSQLFFDNTEFAPSTLSADQTMAGVHFAPEIGLKWESFGLCWCGFDEKVGFQISA